MEVGIKHTQEITVTDKDTAKVYTSGTLEVFATPAMIALMENTCMNAVAPFLEEGCATVGTALNVKHVAATPVGMTVRCECELTAVDGRALTFAVSAYDDAGLIGEGSHERFIIKADKFMAKAEAKRT